MTGGGGRAGGIIWLVQGRARVAGWVGGRGKEGMDGWRGDGREGGWVGEECLSLVLACVHV